MNVQDQLIVKEFGKSFKTRVRKSLMYFQDIQEPFQNTIKDTLQEWFQSFAPIEDPMIKQQVVDTCFYRYLSRYESQLYRFLLNILDYLFTGRLQQLEFKDEINYKYLTVVYIEQLRSYYQNRQRRSFTRLYDKLKDLKTQKETDEGQEGFIDAMFDDNEPQQSKKAKNQVGNQSFIEEGDGEVWFSKKDMQVKEDMISALNTRIKQREQNLIEITAGYLKDIQLLREQLFRKEYSNVQESYDVSYINISEVMDPKYRDLVNYHLEDLKIQYEKRTQDLYRLIDSQKVEIRNLKTQIQSLQTLTKTMDTPFDMIHKALRFEPNPYKIWKILQDIKGNFYFREVFENQRAIYGINYRELNQLMMSSKAYEREFVLYKQQVQDQQYVFYEKALKEVEISRVQIQERQNEILEMQNQMELKKEEYIEAALKTMQDTLNQYIDVFRNEFENEKKRFLDEVKKLEVSKLRQALQLWAMTNRILKLTSKQFDDPIQVQNEVKALFIENKIYYEVTRGFVTQILTAKQQNKILQEANKKLTFRNLELQQQLKLNGDYQEIKNQADELKQKIYVLETQKRQIETQKELIEHSCSQIIGLIDPKMAHVILILNSKFKTEELKLFDKQSDLAQDFASRIKQLDQSQLRSVKEIHEQSQKNLLAFNSFVQHKFPINVFTQTDIQDVYALNNQINLPLGYESSSSSSSSSSESVSQLSSQIIEQNEEVSASENPQLQVHISTESEHQFDRGGVQFSDKRTQFNGYEVYISELLRKQQEQDDEIKKNRKQMEKLKQKLKAQVLRLPKNQQKSFRGSILNMELESDCNIKPIHSRQSISEEGLKRVYLHQYTQASNAHKHPERDKQISQLKLDISIDQSNSRGASKQEQRYSALPIEQRSCGTEQKVNSPIQDYLANQPGEGYTYRQGCQSDFANSCSSTKSNQRKVILNLIPCRKQQQVYERLFEESEKKAERIRELKEKLQILEKSHWDDVLQIFSAYQARHEEFQSDIQNMNQSEVQTEKLPTFKSSTPYKTRSNQNYYEKMKRKEPNISGEGDIYTNWFGRKHLEMGKMLQNFDLVQSRRGNSLTAANTLSPTVFKFRSKTSDANPKAQARMASKNPKSRQGVLTLTPDSYRFQANTPYVSLLPPTISNIVMEQQTKKAAFKIH